MAEILVGTCGYRYRHWRDVLYPPDLGQDDWLSHYASRFPSVELDTTFYGLPDKETVKGWRRDVPKDFRFAVKLSRYGTHMKRLREPEAGWLERFLDAVEPMGAALGPILAQLPPRWHRDVERLEGFLEAMPRRYRVAVEFRDPDWLDASVYDVLREHGAALVIHDLVEGHPRLETTDWVYLRFHGPSPGQTYAGSYPPQALSGAARRIRAHAQAGCDVYAYFNNDTQGHAVRNATDLQRYLDRS